jgi:HEAT repeat protein
MLERILIAISLTALAASGSALAQDDNADELKIAALEALIAAPPERALPAVRKVLQGNNSDEVKESALFILSQIDRPEAQALLMQMVREADGDLQEEAIQMVGIGGNPGSLAELREIYPVVDIEAKEAILEALMIADQPEAVLEIAIAAETEVEFVAAVEMLAVMDATEELRQVRERAGVSEGLIEAYAISGDYESLRELALDASNPDQQVHAIEALGIVGHEDADATLIEIYRGSDNEDVKEAALDGMLISGYDAGVLELYRNSTDTGEKRELLEYLVMMDSDEIWDIIDAALEEQR